MLSTSRLLPCPRGNDFFTPCRVTASRVCVMALSRRKLREGQYVVCPSACHYALPNGDGIDRHPNTAPQQQRAEDKEEFVGLVLRQFVQVEDLDDVGTAVPEKIGVQRQPLKSSKSFPG